MGGVTVQGVKTPLGFVQTSSEHHQPCSDLFKDLIRRGLKIPDGILCVLDGAKGFKKAVEDGVIPPHLSTLAGTWGAVHDSGELTYMNVIHLGGIDGRRIAASMSRIVIASAFMAVAAAAADAWLPALIPGPGLLPQLARLCLDLATALAVLAGAAHLLRIPEFQQGAALVTQRLTRRRE